MDSGEMIKILKRDGWYKVGTVSSHNHYKYPIKKVKVTVPHPRKNIPIKL